MEIYLARDGQRLGPFSPDEVRRQLATGTAKPTDLAWSEGSPGWIPLSSLPEMGMMAAGAPPPPPAAFPVIIYHAGRTSSTAVASLVFGILSLSILPLVASIPAVILGHIARREIRTSGGAITGDGMALAGLIIGYIYGGLLILCVLIFVAMILLGVTLPLLNQHPGGPGQPPLHY